MIRRGGTMPQFSGKCWTNERFRCFAASAYTSHGVASTMCASSRNILWRSIDHVCKCKREHRPCVQLQETSYGVASTMCASARNVIIIIHYHPHPNPPHPNPVKNQKNAFRTTADYKPGSNYYAHVVRRSSG